MSLWFTATISLNMNHVHPDKDPEQGILNIFNKHGINIKAPLSEMSLRKLTKEIFEINICNPNSLLDEIHNSLKDLIKQPYISGVSINKHYYF